MHRMMHLHKKRSLTSIYLRLSRIISVSVSFLSTFFFVSFLAFLAESTVSLCLRALHQLAAVPTEAWLSKIGDTKLKRFDQYTSNIQ